jgi:hypothetical protein
MCPGVLPWRPMKIDAASLKLINQRLELLDLVAEKQKKALIDKADLTFSRTLLELRKAESDSNKEPSKTIILQEIVVKAEVRVNDATEMLKKSQAGLEKAKKDFDIVDAQVKEINYGNPEIWMIPEFRR